MDDSPDPAELLVTFVRGRDVECPTCSYNLRDLKSSLCPECGERLVLRLQASKPRVGVLIAGLLPLTMALGFSGALFLYAFWARVSWGYWLWDGASEVLLFLVSIGTLSALTWLWSSRWNRVRAWKPHLRNTLLAAFWVVSIGAVMAIFAAIG